MKKILYTLLASTLFLTGCYVEEFEPTPEDNSFSSFSASIADIGITRSHLEGGKQVVWDEWDWIGIYSDKEDVKSYYYEEPVFKGEAISGNTFYAFYPFNEDAVDSNNRNIIHVNLWGGIRYTEDSYNRPLPMVAKSTDNNLKFKQTCGLIRFSLKGTNLVNHVRLEVNNREIITGEGIIDISQDNPILKMVPDEEDTWRSSIDMWPQDLQLKADENTDFYFIVPVGVYEKGLTLYIYGTNPTTNEEFSIEKRTDKEVNVRRAMIKTFTGLDTDAILKEEADEIMRERQALMDLYNSTDGANWKNNENWGSDKPLSEWYGVGTYKGLVRYLSLYDNGLKGSIPESIDLLTDLTDLQLGKNQLSGSIPESIGNLVNLEYLYLSNNQFSGSISESIGKLENLRSLNLSENQFSGSIPKSIGKLANLKDLSLSNNQLSGSIPESIGKLVNLEYLYLSNNQLPGSISESIGKLENLISLDLSNNQLSGSIPNSIERLSNLKRLSLTKNQLTGTIPEGICKLVNLENLNLGNNQLSGSIPKEIGNLKDLKYLSLNNNLLTGTLPDEIWNLTNLVTLNIGQNEELTGTLSENIGNLTHLENLFTQYSPISGEIPDSFCNLTELRVFAAAFSNFSGSLPENFGNLRSLEDIRMCANHLTGPLPKSIGNLKNLKVLMIRWNELSGDLPASMGNMTSLEKIYLEGNKLTGGIPDSFMNLSNLTWMNVSGNCMSGSISEKMYQSAWWNQVFTSISQRNGYGLKIGNAYTSSDFSRDGEYKVLQRHSKGKGISLVITGDGFSDRLIEDGTFDSYAKKAMDYFFEKEPYTSFREFFDVYRVTAVSKNDIIGLETVFESKVYGDKYNYNLNTIQNYVNVIPDLKRDLANVTTLVILNDPVSGSRVNCHMYSDGFAIGLCTVSDNMKSEINHEIGGHGFAKLADEYWSDDKSGTPFTDKSDLDNLHKNGWYVNVDYVNDPQKVLWRDFINNADYKVENIGIYEGGFAEYRYGIYRPTEYSIMRNNVGEYNAPSRWAIYKHIMELAGESYTFQDFLAYDKKNLERIANNANTRSYVEKSAANVDVSQLGAPPVIYDYPSSEIGLH